MTTHAAERSPLVRARVAGALYLLANIFAPFTLLYLPSRFIVRGDAAATANKILHDQGLLIAHIFFGLWLLPMGHLVFRSDFIPGIVGVLLVIAGAGYVVQSFASFLGYNVNIILFTGLGELVFLLWLLIKGVNVEQWKKRALESP
jgi:hypothetical protein